MYKKIFLLFTGLISFSCCSIEIINLSDAKHAIIQYHDSGRYEEDLSGIVQEAKLKFDEINFTGSMVVIFDVDETALLNYEINKDLDFGYIPDLWNKWVLEARAPALEPAKNLYDYLLQRGSKIIFITGRKYNEYDATIKNLMNEGYTLFDTLITRNENEKGLTAVEYKSYKRTELTNKGYTIAGTVGDQWSDLEGAFHGIQVKFPNYIYSID